MPTLRRRRASLSLALMASAALIAGPALAKGVLLHNRIGPSKENLFIANADGTGERPLLGAQGVFDYDANFSPDGRWITFTSERDADGTGQADVYRVHPDGTGLERLTADPAMEDAGALSPDGKSLAYVSTKGGAKTTNVWIMDLATKQARNLTAIPELATPGPFMHSFFRPSWSPDGRWIAFSSDRGSAYQGAEGGAGAGHTQSLSVYIIHPDGTGLRRLTLGGAITDGAPRWSPDGKRVVFYEIETRNTSQARFTGTPPAQIVSVDIATGARQVHTTGPGLKVQPTWLSADRIAFLVKGPPTGGNGRDPAAIPAGLAYVQVLPPRAGPPGGGGFGFDGPPPPTPQPSYVSNLGPIRNPTWSPDGKTVVYQKHELTNRAQYTRLHSWDPNLEAHYTDVFPEFSSKGRLAVTDLNFPIGNPDASISVMDYDGKNRIRAFYSKEAASMTPSFSPDGQWIAFSLGQHFGARNFQGAKIMMVKTDGSESRELVPGVPNSGFPTWSPDGKSIIFRAWGGNDVRGLRKYDIASKKITVLTDEWDNFPFYSPSGDRVVFTRQKKSDQDFDVFSMKPDGTDVRQLTSFPGSDGHATWTADGKQLWFYSAKSGFKDESSLYDNSPQPYAQVHLMNRDGTDVRQITDSRWEDSMAVIVPDAAMKK